LGLHHSFGDEVIFGVALIGHISPVGFI